MNHYRRLVLKERYLYSKDDFDRKEILIDEEAKVRKFTMTGHNLLIKVERTFLNSEGM